MVTNIEITDFCEYLTAKIRKLNKKLLKNNSKIKKTNYIGLQKILKKM